METHDVAATASILNISEFDVFCLAYRNWFGKLADSNEISRIFDSYLKNNTVPMWVRDFNRKIQQLYDNNELDSTIELGFNSADQRSIVLYKNILLGSIIIIGLLFIVVLLLHLAMLAQDSLALKCVLPPCY